MTFWAIFLGVPTLVLGAGMLFCPERTKAAVERFEKSRVAAAVLTAVAWAWTAYECDTIGVDVFDMICNRFTGQVWIMAAVLAYLTFIWMPKNLPVRALTGIFMLIPAEFFKQTRAVVPDGGFAPVQLAVLFAYALAVVGMYGMFYPWRLEKAFALVAARPVLMRTLGAVGLVVGAAVFLILLSVR